MLGGLLLLSACSLGSGGKAAGGSLLPSPPGAESARQDRVHRLSESYEIEDLRRIPQRLDWLAAAAADRLVLSDPCRDRLLDEFQRRFFAPWEAGANGFDPEETRQFMVQQGRATWYGANKRVISPEEMQEIMSNCDIQGFPSRNDTAIAVAPGHLRGLPTRQPFFESAGDFPFDMLSFPHVKLNEPLRVLHTSRDGGWLFVQTGYTTGWLERRDVALVDQAFIECWKLAPHLVVVRDNEPVPDGRGVGVFPAKIGTVLPLSRDGGDDWQVRVASAGEGGRAESRTAVIPRAAAAPFPLAFNAENIARVGDQLLGEPYGWGEAYGLRDCSALLRDFFLPFGIWLPRTSADQVASVPDRIDLARLKPAEKEETILDRGVPFLSLLYKPGHIMLYVGRDAEGRALVFHDAWSVRLSGTAKQEQRDKRDGKDAARQAAAASSSRIIGMTAITTLQPGKELGLAPGKSLLEQATELAVIPNRCSATAPQEPPRR